MTVNLCGAFCCCKAVFPYMKERMKGKIINLSSETAFTGSTGFIHYVTSKGGIISFTKSIAAELGSDGIRANCVAPGWVKTDMSEEAIKKDEVKIREMMPLGFIPEAHHIADGILFLASDMAAAITGEVLSINAGSVMFG